MTGGSSSAQEEQDWNERQLSVPVAEPAWRFWRYTGAAIVLGSSQRAQLATVRARTALPVLVRSAGGGAVLTGPWLLGLSVLLPDRHPLLTGSLVDSYRWLGELYERILRASGIAAATVPRGSALLGRPPDPLSWACFGAFSPWELAVGARKIAGLAQRRRKQGALLTGGLLLDQVDWPLLCAALDRPAAEAAELARRTTGCAQETGALPPIPDFLAQFDAELRCALAAER
jgi:lipoate-protein ligase A